MSNAGRLLLAALAASLLGPFAAGQSHPVGPEFCEGGDAGDLPMNAQKVTGPAGMPVTKINGSLSSTPMPGMDFEDMFSILIEDPFSFTAQVIAAAPTDVLPQLWLFAGPGVDFNENHGILANNGFDVGFDGGAFLGNMSTDAISIQLTVPGIYYLAISGQDPNPGGLGRVPQSMGGDIFEFLPGVFEISSADGVGGGQPITSWAGDGLQGDYSIELTGVVFQEKVPAPGALALVAIGLLYRGRRRLG